MEHENRSPPMQRACALAWSGGGGEGVCRDHVECLVLMFGFRNRRLGIQQSSNGTSATHAMLCEDVALIYIQNND
jgi:hypothetical protein